MFKNEFRRDLVILLNKYGIDSFCDLSDFDLAARIVKLLTRRRRWVAFRKWIWNLLLKLFRRQKKDSGLSEEQ